MEKPPPLIDIAAGAYCDCPKTAPVIKMLERGKKAGNAAPFHGVPAGRLSKWLSGARQR